jgi:charged multivesicular body protein 2A
MLITELLRENKRMLDKSIREIERERQGLQSQEKKLIAEIKKSAKQGQMVLPIMSFFRFFFGLL